MRTFFDFDSKLRTVKMDRPVIFKRYKSLSDLPFDWKNAVTPISIPKEQIEHFRSLINKRLSSKFAVPMLTRSEYGSLVNVDEALAGIPECYRHTRPIKSVLKIGLNLSSAGDNSELYSMRAAAILAVIDLAKKRGQSMQFDICYGDAGVWATNEHTNRVHIRCSVQSINGELASYIMAPKMRSQIMINCIEIHDAWGGYNLQNMQTQYPVLKGEFDFTLDRLDTDNRDIEYARILKQIEHLR